MTVKVIRKKLPYVSLMLAAALTFSAGGGKMAAWAAESEQEEASSESGFDGGTGTAEDPYQISTAEELELVREHLAESFLLTEDIDLGDYESWTPIGTFQSRSDAPEDAEVPAAELAFTGTFDGGGHTIRNVTVEEPQSMGVGLFGCVSGTEEGPAVIRNLTVENVSVTGYYLAGGVVGLQYENSSIEDVTLAGENQIQGLQGIGGIVGTGFDCQVKNCRAAAEIKALGDDGACAGIIMGGSTYGSLVNCVAEGGSVTAEGNACWGIGAICGAPYGVAEIRECQVKDTVIHVTGEDSTLIGGLVGFAGTYPDSDSAVIENCKVENAAILVSDTASCVGGIVGGGIAETGTGVMSSFSIQGCEVSGSITGGGAYIGDTAGNPEGAVNVDCAGAMDRQ